jgi:hypothetical protein
MEEKMFINISNQKKHPVCRFTLGIVAVVLLVAGLCHALLAAEAKQKSFKSPEEAIQALVEAVKKGDTKGLMAIFGPASKDIIFSGDKVADKAGRGRFIAAYEEKNKLVNEGDKKVVLIVGQNDWPMPIPLVKEGEAWLFDTKEGEDEILNRRIGKNELNTIEVCLAYVDAQREYAMKDCDGNRVRDYAQRFTSTRGKKDGLYWETKEGEVQSPMGPLMAKAAKEGYKRFTLSPYHGYYYKILKAQGEHASGGAYSYVTHGNMMGGFALVAYPAEYGNSGIVTFVVNQDGFVYQKDLGKDTKKIAEAMTLYDPDETWQQVK